MSHEPSWAQVLALSEQFSLALTSGYLKKAPADLTDAS